MNNQIQFVVLEDAINILIKKNH